MPPGSNKVLAKIPDDIENQEPKAHKGNGFQDDPAVPGKEILAQVVEDLRKRQIHQGYNQGTKQVRIKEKTVRLIILPEFL